MLRAKFLNYESYKVKKIYIKKLYTFFYLDVDIFKLLRLNTLMKTKIKLNRNEARKLKKAQKRKLRLSKVDFYNNDIHHGTRKISANPVNGLINLEDNNRLHLLDSILLRHRLTK
jgi:hypothetical protein